MDNGANVGSKTNDNQTCLHLASEKGHTDVVQILGQNKWLISEKSKDNFVALGLATKSNHIGVVNCLLDLGAELEETSSHQQHTALHIAAENGVFEIAETLIARGAKVDSSSKYRYSQYNYVIFS